MGDRETLGVGDRTGDRGWDLRATGRIGCGGLGGGGGDQLTNVSQSENAGDATLRVWCSLIGAMGSGVKLGNMLVFTRRGRVITRLK